MTISKNAVFCAISRQLYFLTALVLAADSFWQIARHAFIFRWHAAVVLIDVAHILAGGWLARRGLQSLRLERIAPTVTLGFLTLGCGLLVAMSLTIAYRAIAPGRMWVDAAPAAFLLGLSGSLVWDFIGYFQACGFP